MYYTRKTLDNAMSYRLLLWENENQVMLARQIQFIASLALNKGRILSLLKLAGQSRNVLTRLLDFKCDSIKITVQTPQAEGISIHND